MVLIDELQKEKISLLRRVEAIDLLLSSYGVTEINSQKLDDDTLFGNASKQLSEVSNRFSNLINFPVYGRKDKQVLWIFENKINCGVKISEVQELYNEIKGADGEGKEIRIDNVARRLKKQGKLIIVKYNNQNKASFWGLPSWVNSNGFKDEFAPDEGVLPIDVESVEVLTGK